MEFVDFPWVPVIDGDFLIEQPSTALKQGNFKKIQLLAGSNLDESIYFIVYQLGVRNSSFYSEKNISDKALYCRLLIDFDQLQY